MTEKITKPEIPTEEIKKTEPPKEADLQKKLQEAQEKAEKNWQTLLLVKADMENLRKRSERDIASAHKYALERFSTDLLQVLDSLEKAIETSEKALAEDKENTVAKNIFDGIKLTESLFLSTIKKYGIEKISPLGKPFDHNFHEAISTVEDKTVEPNTVVQVFQNGYLLNGRLIRPALVIVSK